MKSEKITKTEIDDETASLAAAAEAIGWRYNDACGAAHALDLVGERWALLVMRELMLGPRRFTDLRANLPGISANVLTQRLGRLEALGIVERVTLGPPAGRAYSLTPWGYEARPIFSALGSWAARSPLHDKTRPLSGPSLMMSMETMFRAERAAGVDLTVAMVIAAERYVVSVTEGRIATVRSAERAAAAGIAAGSAMSIVAWLYGGVPLEALEADGTLTLSGERDVLATLPTLFELPPQLRLSTQGGRGCE